MHPLLSKLESAADLHGFTNAQLTELAAEIRDALCNLLQERTAHFASNLGVVELCLALHSVFDFRTDRLIWDTGHQIYPHKLVTGRYPQFRSMRTKGGLMGYPNPHESLYDLFMTGHAGASLSCISGLRSGDDQLGHPSGVGRRQQPDGVAVGRRLGAHRVSLRGRPGRQGGSCCSRVTGPAEDPTPCTGAGRRSSP